MGKPEKKMPTDGYYHAREFFHAPVDPYAHISPMAASPLRMNQVHPGGQRHENVRGRSVRTDNMPVTTIAGGYRGNPYLCGTEIEVAPRAGPEYYDSRTAQSMMRYGYGFPYNPQHHLSVRPYTHNLANAGAICYPNAKSEPRPRYFLP